MRPAFEVLEPAAAETPVIVEIPHAAVDAPPSFLAPICAPARALARDADLYVDGLYEDATAVGATVLRAAVSRYAIDVNRAETDVDADVVEGARSDVRMNHGLIWRTTSEGEPALSRKLTPAELEERLAIVWRPYHARLSALIERKRRQFGVCVVLAAHSMPSVERGAGSGARSASRATPRADVVPGTRGRKSADAQYIEALEGLSRAQGWTVRHDDPYAGGFTTRHYGRPSEGVHVLQVELARRLYLDEESLRPRAEFEAVRAWCRSLTAELGRVACASA